jgi:hypothetical protein
MTIDMEQRKPLWAKADRQDVGMSLVLIGLGMALYGFGTVGYPRILVPLIMAVFGTVLLERGVHYYRNPFPAGFGEMPEMGTDMGYGMGYPLYQGQIHPEVARLMEVVNATWKGEIVALDQFVTEGDMLVSYALHALKPGYFTESGTKRMVSNKLSNAVPARKSSWEIDFDLKNDNIYATQKSKLKSLLLPPMWPVVADEVEARRRYPDFEYCIGEGADGPIKFKPSQFAHMGIYGSTGGGKSVTTRAILEQFRAAGFQLFICDGKGTDYTPMSMQPNVVAVASDIQSQIAVVHMVRRIMNQRRKLGTKRGVEGMADWRNHQTPLLLVMDEFATTINDISTRYPKSVKMFLDDIAAILKVGREMRVHILLATQDMRAKTTPGDWLNNITVNICMGRPKDQIIEKGFPSALQSEATRIGDQISATTPGRGLVATLSENGIPSAELFQSYYSYSPGGDLQGQKGAALRNWTQFKDQVSERIRPLYSRMWFIPEYPQPEPGGKDAYAEQRKKFDETGLVDLTELDIPDIHKLKNVALENRSGAIPDHREYDPRSSLYIAREDLNDAETVNLSL